MGNNELIFLIIYSSDVILMCKHHCGAYFVVMLLMYTFLNAVKVNYNNSLYKIKYTFLITTQRN